MKQKSIIKENNLKEKYVLIVHDVQLGEQVHECLSCAICFLIALLCINCIRNPIYKRSFSNYELNLDIFRVWYVFFLIKSAK